MENEITKPSESSFLSVPPQKLFKALFNADVPEEEVKKLPAQNLYMAIQYNGLSSSTDLINMTTVAQRRLLMDFDCWEKDNFNEDNFFNWLALTDEENSLDLLIKIFKSSDLKLVAMLITKYVTIHSQTEPTDMPPAGDFYTPDKGYTWIKVDTGNADHDFLLKRLLALIFENHLELFYQIISIPMINTPTELEEMAYEEKNKRLASEGIPEFEECVALNQPIPRSKIQEKIKSKLSKPRATIFNINSLAFYEDKFTFLNSYIENLNDKETCLSELSRILNACIVFYDMSFDNLQAIFELTRQVKGALNLGLEALSKDFDNVDFPSIYPVVNLQDIYQYSLNSIFYVKKKASEVLKENEGKLSSLALKILSSFTRRFPIIPSFIKDENNIIVEENGVVSNNEEDKEISSLRDILLIEKILEKIKREEF